MKYNKKEVNKHNLKNFCHCYACRDSGFDYGNNSILIEDNSPLCFQLFGKEVVKE